MKSPFSKFPLQDFDNIQSLQQLREQLLNLLLISTFILGTALLGVALIPVFQREMYGFPIIYIIVYVWLILVTFIRRLPYSVRTGSWLMFFYLLGVVNLILSGFNADAGLFFLTFISMSVLLFDLQRGLMALGLSGATIIFFGYITTSGYFEVQLEPPQPADPLLWIIGGGVFLLTSVSLIIVLTVLVRGLVVSLIKVQEQADESFNVLLENSMQGIIVFQDNRIVYLNRAIMTTFGYSLDEIGLLAPEEMLNLVHPENRVMLLNRLQHWQEGRHVTERYELRAFDKMGEMHFLDVASVSIIYRGRPALQTTVVDLTGRKKMEQTLRENEETSRAIINATEDIMVLLDASGMVLAANNITAERLGKTLNEILGHPVHQFFPEETSKPRDSQLEKAIQTGKPIHFEDSRNGLWFENRFYPILDESGRVTRAVVSSRDVTERKRMEQSLADAKDELEVRVAERTRELSESREQLRSLTNEVLQSQEKERRRVSRELHDEAGQALVSMKYTLEAILADLSDKEPPIQKRLASAIQQLDQTMEQIRFLAHSLRPPLLDIADLDLTLRDYCREFGESTGLQIEYTGASVPNLSEAAGLSFFRFLQEALTNVVKHASATSAQVRLETYSDSLSLTVADNGMGQINTVGEGQGHLGMRERFRMLNGQVQINSQAGAGFTITASIPYPHEVGGGVDKI